MNKTIVFMFLLALTNYVNAFEAPQLKLSVENFTVSAIWNPIEMAAGYKLYYAPYPQAKPITSLDMGSQLKIAATLPVNSAFYLAVTAYDSQGEESGYSNVDHFVLNEPVKEKMLIVISAPSVHDEYYKKHFKQIIEFDIRYAKAVMGKDDIVVLADKDTLPYFKDQLPKEILLEAEVEDIWLRDFATVHPSKMVKFAYDRPQEPSIEKSFLQFATENALQFQNSSLKVDGGNVVDNNLDKIILTDKVLERNPKLSYSQIVTKLKQALGVTEVAIIPMDEEYLGHSDGMVMFIDDKTVIMNDYHQEPDFKTEVLTALQTQLSGIKVHQITGAGYGEQYGDYASACGIYVNSVVTDNYIYLPVFGNDIEDNAVAKKIQSLTDKTVVTVDTQEVCFLGGNLRCLSWQLTGDNAQKIIAAAKKQW
jgi:agmatine/peptidylarginine deiminase